MLTHGCVGYLKVTNVQNDHHQHHYIVADGIAAKAISVSCLGSCNILGYWAYSVL
jgi:hypothetical protein